MATAKSSDDIPKTEMINESTVIKSNKLTFEQLYSIVSTQNTDENGNEKVNLTGEQMYYQLKTFIEKKRATAPMFPWVALFIAYGQFFRKYGNLSNPDLETTMYKYFIEIGLMTNGLKFIYVHTLFDDLFMIRKSGFEHFENIIMSRIANPEWDKSWINDMYIFAEYYRKTYNIVV
jgi:hypothetical protein